SATANFVADGDLAGASSGDAPFGADGRGEYPRDRGGWLISADAFRLRTADGTWPRASWQVRVLAARPGVAATLAGNASSVNLADRRYILAWIPPKQRELLRGLAPSGVVRDARFRLAGRGSADQTFELAAEMDRVGIAPYENFPGIRGFSGTLRADQSGGRLEIHSGDLQLDLTGHLVEPVDLVEADGTIVWRQNESGLTLLSDSIRLRNADVESASSLQVTIPAGEASPFVDLQSSFSVRDIGSVERY